MKKTMPANSLVIDGKRYTGIIGSRLPSDFKRAVDMLQRPYVYISEDDYKRLWNIDADIFYDRYGKQYTHGNCDGGHYALMPLQRECYYQVA